MGVSSLRRAAAGGAALVLLVAASSANAEPRPTQGGLWSFDEADVVESWDEESANVRAHYSVAGPNRTLLADADEDGVPDFPQRVARTTADALVVFEGLGFRLPTRESEGGERLGGSDAYDIYLVDFAGAADGRFGIDACAGSPPHCAGFLVIENDFFGYSYPTLEIAVDTVAVHEGFHAVQAAYAELPTWMSEGSATWAERAYDPASVDFLRACNGYLADHTRPLYQPPPGPVPSFAYGSALWFDFLVTRFDAAVIADVLSAVEAAPGDPVESVMVDVVGRGGAFEEAWVEFARSNLATGFRAGVATSHAYSASLDAIEADYEGPSFDEDVRLFPMAAEYWRLELDDGPLFAGSDAALEGVVFSLHPVAEFALDGAVGDAIDVWSQTSSGGRALFGGEALPAGGYWVVAANATVGANSAQARVCIGTFEDASACALIDDGGDTDGASETEGSSSGDETGEGSSSGEPSTMATSEWADSTGPSDATGGEGESSGGPGQAGDAGGGCGCTASGPGRLEPFVGLFFAIAMWGRRRR